MELIRLTSATTTVSSTENQCSPTRNAPAFLPSPPAPCPPCRAFPSAPAAAMLQCSTAPSAMPRSSRERPSSSRSRKPPLMMRTRRPVASCSAKQRLRHVSGYPHAHVPRQRAQSSRWKGERWWSESGRGWIRGWGWTEEAYTQGRLGGVRGGKEGGWGLDGGAWQGVARFRGRREKRVKIAQRSAAQRGALALHASHTRPSANSQATRVLCSFHST